MKLILTKHASQKIIERQINLETLEEVLNNHEYLFYDLKEKTLIAISKVKIKDIQTNLIVVFTEEKEGIKIVTTYPCRNIEKEISKKENIRWVRI
ncbi:hypothetical protein CN13_01560 [Petrotoga sp. HKA.pet.4.5]|jgi:hypothetical protein|uniref:DUF4258 domain-containing protein n=1 Tax=unclassified Petrotoga TaxID=2620614 RepID=UPI000EF138A8|nr:MULTISPECIES: DUF4258 domain-containing protein [unclassified Petrotoga]RLL83968.1 hypothetical protein BZ25_06135 [Petrotoga sp. Shatin.DS.tank11.9.2.9.3]RLL90408.1 hypothetical protein CN13_01560 [Petrotoga sp. HKA.pet.4.5]